MTIEDKIDALRIRAGQKVSQKSIKEKMELYTAGLKEKIREARFSLDNIREYELQDSDSITDTGGNHTIDENIHFFCDCFWIFLYASLDVLAQVVNQTEKLRLKEKDVSFKQVCNCLPQRSILRRQFHKIKNGYAFRNLDKYRNCSLHRRHIYFQTKSKSVRGSNGYSISATGTHFCETKRYLCDDPLKLPPKIDQKRGVGKYCGKTFNKIMELMEVVVDNILS